MTRNRKLKIQHFILKVQLPVTFSCRWVLRFNSPRQETKTQRPTKLWKPCFQVLPPAGCETVMSSCICHGTSLAFLSTSDSSLKPSYSAANASETLQGTASFISPQKMFILSSHRTQFHQRPQAATFLIDCRKCLQSTEKCRRVSQRCAKLKTCNSLWSIPKMTNISNAYVHAHRRMDCCLRRILKVSRWDKTHGIRQSFLQEMTWRPYLWHKEH